MLKSKPAAIETIVIDETLPPEIRQYVSVQRRNYLLPINNTEIMVLALFDKFDYLQFLIERRKEINLIFFKNNETSIPEFTESDINGENVLFYAIRGGRERCLAYLLSQGIDIHKKNVLGETPYVFALRLGKNDLANQLADFDSTVAHIDLASIRTNYSLHEAFVYALNMGNSWKETIECFLSFKKEINNEESFSLTPLQYMLLWWGQEYKAKRLHWSDYHEILPNLITYLAERGASLVNSTRSISDVLRTMDEEYDRAPTSLAYYLRAAELFNPAEREIISLQELAPDYACYLYLIKAKYYYLQVGDRISAMEYMRKAEFIQPTEFEMCALNNITFPEGNFFKGDERRIVVEFVNTEKRNIQQAKESKKTYKTLRTYGTFTSAASETLPLQGKLAKREEWLATVSRAYL